MTNTAKCPTPEQVEELKDEFLAHLIAPLSIVVVGGAPGAGKTTVAKELADFFDLVHVQSNSARQLLREHGFSYGKNVHDLVESVVRRLLSQGRSVVLDGMVREESERELFKKTANEYGARVFFIAILCNPAIAEERDKKRSLDSSFDDWRPNPENLDAHHKSMWALAEQLEKELSTVPDKLDGGVFRIINNGSKRELLGETEEIVWDHIGPKLK